MISIASKAKFRQRVIRYSEKWTIVNKMDKKMCTKRKNKELQPD